MIHFDKFQCYDTQFSLSIAEGIAALLSIAGIHKCLYDARPWTIADGETSGVFSRSGHHITATDYGTIKLCKAGGNIIIGGSIIDGASYMVGSGPPDAIASGVGVRFTDAHIEFFDSTGSTRSRWPRGSEDVYARILFHEIVNYKLNVEYKIVAVYVGDSLVAANAIKVDYDVSSESVYLIMDNAGTVLIEINDLGGFAKNASVDPGESVTSGLGRLVLGLPLHLFARYDGTARYYSPVPRDAEYNLINYINQARGVRQTNNYRALSGIVRAVSALPEAEYLHVDSVDKVGSQFNIAQNPNILTYEGALIEAERVQRKSRETFRTLEVQGYAFPLMEPGDVFLANGEKWIHNSGDFTLETNGSYKARIAARHYEQ